jgi:hypothetical protein
MRLSPRARCPAATAVPDSATSSAAMATTIDADGLRPKIFFIGLPFQLNARNGELCAHLKLTAPRDDVK